MQRRGYFLRLATTARTHARMSYALFRLLAEIFARALTHVSRANSNIFTAIIIETGLPTTKLGRGVRGPRATTAPTADAVQAAAAYSCVRQNTFYVCPMGGFNGRDGWCCARGKAYLALYSSGTARL